MCLVAYCKFSTLSESLKRLLQLSQISSLEVKNRLSLLVRKFSSACLTGAVLHFIHTNNPSENRDSTMHVSSLSDRGSVTMHERLRMLIS